MYRYALKSLLILIIFSACILKSIHTSGSTVCLSRLNKSCKIPVIGLSGNYLEAKNHKYRHFVNESYVNLVVEAGGAPVIIPITENSKVIQNQVDTIDGLILTGGSDIDPVLYGEKPSPKLGPVKARRDKFDMILLQKAIKSKVPVLGICRGHQIINIAYNGKLYQDIPSMTHGSVKHARTSGSAYHVVKIKEGTWLYRALGVKKKLVDSSHHQGIKELAPGFTATAVTDDGMVEALEKEHGPFLVGIQFHPEKMFRHDNSMLKLMKEFIRTCSKNHSKVKLSK